MNASNTSEYLLLLRGTQLEEGLPSSERQKAMDAFTDWYERLTREGTLKVGQPLTPIGKIISGKSKRIVTDGPFAEAKEAIGGYLLLAVKSFDEAVAIGETCPLLDYGAAVEVRPIKAQCPTVQQVNERLARDPVRV